jgi:uncharacterized protein (UPF0261 family)
VSTTEVADEIGGGVLSAGAARLDVFARHALPYVGSCGALDMVNFGAWDTVPERFKARRLYRHNPGVTLMRTTADECRAIGEFIARQAQRHARAGALPDPRRRRLGDRQARPPFHDPEADRVLFRRHRTAGLPHRTRAQPVAPAAPHQRRRLRRRAGGRLAGNRAPPAAHARA